MHRPPLRGSAAKPAMQSSARVYAKAPASASASPSFSSYCKVLSLAHPRPGNCRRVGALRPTFVHHEQSESSSRFALPMVLNFFCYSVVITENNSRKPLTATKPLCFHGGDAIRATRFALAANSQSSYVTIVSCEFTSTDAAPAETKAKAARARTAGCLALTLCSPRSPIPTANAGDCC
jgi:hypothetical protein